MARISAVVPLSDRITVRRVDALAVRESGEALADPKLAAPLEEIDPEASVPVVEDPRVVDLVVDLVVGSVERVRVGPAQALLLPWVDVVADAVSDPSRSHRSVVRGRHLKSSSRRK